jgi:hypothetical protein
MTTSTPRRSSVKRGKIPCIKDSATGYNLGSE